MTTLRTALSAATLFALISPAFAGITIGPVRGQPGESVRLVTFSEAQGGTIQRNYLGESSTGKIEITRERDLVWTFRAPAACAFVNDCWTRPLWNGSIKAASAAS